MECEPDFAAFIAKYPNHKNLPQIWRAQPDETKAEISAIVNACDGAAFGRPPWLQFMFVEDLMLGCTKTQRLERILAMTGGVLFCAVAQENKLI